MGDQAVDKDQFAIHHSKAYIVNPGDSQTNQVIYYANHTGGTTSELYTDINTTSRINVTVGRIIAYEIQYVVVDVSGSNDNSYFHIFGLINNIGTGATMVGSPLIMTIGETNKGRHTPSFYATGSDELGIQITSTADCKATAYVRYTEVTFP
jgi:hypothetical protein